MRTRQAIWATGSGVEGSLGDPSLRFPYWSFTKTAIAICAFRLAELGRVDLDAPLPGARYGLRQLLAHTAGLPDYGELAEYHRAVAAGEDPWPRDRLVASTLAAGTVSAPGARWAYSNLGYMFAREHIEAASGLGFARLFDEMIARPLALRGVALATTREDFTRLGFPSAGYHPGWVYHGCLVGTARDALAILRGLVSGELLGPESLRGMYAAHPLGGEIPGRPWRTHGYGVGLMTGEAEVGTMIGHSGGGPFGVSAVYHFPDRGEPVTVACFAPGTDPGVAEFEAVGLAKAARARALRE